jgi:hypothetical protein
MSTAQSFQLSAHFLDNRRKVHATFDGLSWTVATDGGQLAAPDLNRAIRVAHQHIGQLLRRVGRRDGWRLRVEVAGVATSYGEPDPLEPVFPGGPADPNSLVSRIRARWQDGASPEAALDNALEVVRAYLGRGGTRRRAAA